MATAMCVMCLNDGQIFESAGSAARWYNIGREQVGRCVRGLRQSVDGLCFALVREDEARDRAACIELRRQQLYNRMKIQNCGELGVTFICDDEPFPDLYAPTADDLAEWQALGEDDAR